MAILNYSSSEKTLKRMLNAIDSDVYTIDRCILYCKYNNKNTQVQFGNILDNYLDYFENTDNCIIEMEVPKRFYYQPAAFAENYYGSADLDWLVLYFAKMTSLFEFTKPKIKVLNKSHLLDINRLIVDYAKDVKKSYEDPVEYLKEEVIK